MSIEELDKMALKVLLLCKAAESAEGRLFAHKFNSILNGVVESVVGTEEPLRTEIASEIARRVHQMRKGVAEERRVS